VLPPTESVRRPKQQALNLTSTHGNTDRETKTDPQEGKKDGVGFMV
jgi:hypothetical protein